MKLAVVGAGSTYTPELVDGLVRMRELLPVDALALRDIDTGRLEILAAVTRRMLDRAGHPAQTIATARLDEAVEGADAVLIQLRVGGQAVRIVDESIPVACGCVGQETTGYGGLAKAFRTVPVVLTIAEARRSRLVPQGRDKRLAAKRLLALDRFDPPWPARIVHDVADGEIWLDRAAMP